MLVYTQKSIYNLYYPFFILEANIFIKMMERLTEVSIRIYTPKCLLYKRFRGEVKIIDIRRNNDYIAHLISFPADQLERSGISYGMRVGYWRT